MDTPAIRHWSSATRSPARRSTIRPSVLFPAEYTGNYFFGDYVSGWINRLDPANGNAVYAFGRGGSS